MPKSKLQETLCNPRTFGYGAIISGLLCPTVFFAGFIAAGFIPPIRPSLTAEQTARHYQKHEAGVRTGACLILMSSMFYLPYSALITAQMDRIPRVPRGLNYLQIASAAAGIAFFMIPGLILALIGYRVERDANTTQMLNDAFWIFAVMPIPTFLAQNWAFSYAILCDYRERPLFPQYVGYFNIIAPIMFAPSLGLHCVKSGVVAWNGAFGFWVPAVVFGLQFGIDSFTLFKAVKTEDYEFDDLTSNGADSNDSSPAVLKEINSGVRDV